MFKLLHDSLDVRIGIGSQRVLLCLYYGHQSFHSKRVFLLEAPTAYIWLTGLEYNCKNPGNSLNSEKQYYE